MNLREMSAVISTILVIVGTTWYIRLLIRGEKVVPVLATWIVLGSTMLLSLATYLTTSHASVVGNACNVIGAVSSVSVTVVIAAIASKSKKGLSLSRLQKWILSGAATIAGYWIVYVWVLHRQGILPNILTQVLMLIGYFFTVQKLWSAQKNTESLFLWWCLSIASAIGIYTAIVSKDIPAIVYSSRATFASVTLVWLMHRAERRARSVR